MLLKLPVLGPVLRKVVVARFTRTMGTLLSSGVPILDAMDIVARTAGNKVVEQGILYAKSQISEGKDLASPLMETGLMPPMVVQMIAVGEQTGALDAMLTKIADFYEEEVDVAVASMTSLIEPLMMVFLGTVIGGLVVAMYMPIFEMAGNIKTGLSGEGTAEREGTSSLPRAPSLRRRGRAQLLRLESSLRAGDPRSDSGAPPPDRAGARR